MKKHTYRRRIEPRAPMLVVMHSLPDLSLTERLSVQAMAAGYADTDHFDNLADCRDIMAMASVEHYDQSAVIACELGLHALLGIKHRYDSTGKMGATGEELKALQALVDTSEDFWKRQSGALFARHYKALKNARKNKEASA